MLTAYLDESGQEQDDWMIIAGFMGDDAAWRKFPELWLKAIGPQREHLHMQSLRFSKRSVRRMLEKAALVPKECNLVPIIAVARLKDYADLLTQEEDKLIHAAYMMCCKTAAIIAMRSLPENERIEIVFERQDRYGWLAEQEFHRISKLTEHPELLMADGKTSKLANWRFVNKEDTVLCEPADYLAYALLQRARNPNSIKSQWTYPILDAHLKEGYSAAVLRETAKGVIMAQKKENIIKTIAHIKQIIMDEEAKRIKSENTPKESEE